MKPPVLVSLALLLCSSLHADQRPTTVRKPGEDVNSADLRMRQSLTSSDTMLFNGWGVSPAGAHVACGDLALNSCCPDNISYATAPTEYKSER